jgi:glucose-1-phosphate thymidylyltransferase
MGVNHAQIVTSPAGQAEMFRNYRDAINGLDVSWHVQRHPNGSADALGCTALKGVFPVLCGDVYFDPAPEPSHKPTLYWTELETADQHSVYDPKENIIIEKPQRDIGKRAVVAYFYDERVYDIIPQLEPTERGELELIDLHNWYLNNGADVREYKGFFGDMGTPSGLLRVANHIKDKHETV